MSDTAATGDSTLPASGRDARLYNSLLAAGAFCVPLSFLDLPIPGGETKPLTAILWLPLFVGLVARLLVRQRGNIVELCSVGILLVGLFWLPVVIGRGLDFPEYVVRMAAYTAGGLVAAVAASQTDPAAIRLILRALLAGFGVVMAYAGLVQLPGALGIDSLAELDQSIRKALLVRSHTRGQVTLFANEPSFAAFELAGLLSILLMFRYMATARAVLGLAVLAAVLMVFAKSITALALLFMVVAAWAFRKGLRASGAFGLLVVGLLGVGVLFAAWELLQHFGPAARVAALETDPSANARLFLAQAAWNAGFYADGFGIGPGQFSARWNEFIPIDSDFVALLPQELKDAIQGGGRRIKPFSVFGGLFGEFGLPGLLLLLTLFASLWWRIAGAGRADGWSLVLILGLVFVAMNGAYPPSLPILWLVIGLMHAKLSLERRVGGLGAEAQMASASR